MRNRFLLSLLLSLFLSAFLSSVASTTQDGIPIAIHYDGGEEKLLADIQAELQYPPSAKRNRRQGTVIVSLTLTEDGEVTNLKVVLDKVGAGCGEEAIRVIKTLKFNAPGYQSNYQIPVKFKL